MRYGGEIGFIYVCVLHKVVTTSILLNSLLCKKTQKKKRNRLSGENALCSETEVEPFKDYGTSFDRPPRDPGVYDEFGNYFYVVADARTEWFDTPEDLALFVVLARVKPFR